MTERVNNEIIKKITCESPQERIQAIISLKNLGLTKAVEYLIPIFSENNPEIRNAIISTLLEIGKPAIPCLINALKSQDGTIRTNAIKVLTELKDTSISSEVLNLLKERNGTIRATAIDVLAGIKDFESIEFIRQFINDFDNRVRISAARALGEFKDKLSVDLLLSSLADNDNNVKIAAAEALGKTNDPRACDGLWYLHNTDNNPEVKHAALSALKTIGANVIKPYENNFLSSNIALRAKTEYELTVIGKPALLPLLEYLKHYNPLVRGLAAKILGNIGDDFATKRLIELTNDTEIDVRITAIQALAKIKSETALKYLITCLRNPDPVIVDTASKSLATRASDIINLLPNLLSDSDLDLQITTARLVGRIGEPGFVLMLAEHLNDPRMWLRRTVCFALGETKNPVAATYLIEKGLNDPETLVRTAAIRALGNLKIRASTNTLIRILHDKEENIQLATIEALGKIGDVSAGKHLLDFLTSETLTLKIMAIKAIRQIKYIPAIPILKKLTKTWPFGSESKEVRIEAKTTLRELIYEAQFTKP